jgi:FkbM family methyltransferase
MPLVRQAIGALSRRLGQPELLALVYAGARQALREEIAIRAILASSLRAEATFIDVGTNRGQILREAVRVAPRGRHLAFEPIPALAADLAREFPGVDCRPMALGAKAGTATFCHFRRLDGWSGLQRTLQVSDADGDPEYIPVTVSTLDAEVGHLTPAVIKIDVEGAERDVIEGGRAVLSQVRPLLIFEHVATAAELYGASSEMVWDLLAELDYEIYSVTGDGPFTRAAFTANLTVVNWLARPGAKQPDTRVS